MSQYKKLLSHSFLYGVAPQVTKVANFVALPLITKHLTAVDYGITGTLTAYTTSISVLATLGIRTVLVNSYFKSPGQYKWAWRQLYGFLRIWSIPYSLLVAILLYCVMPPEAEQHKFVLIAASLIPVLLFGNASMLATTYYQISKNPKEIVWRTVVFGLLTVVLNVYFIADLKLGFLGWIYASFISGTLSNITYWYALRYKLKMRPIFNFKWRLIKSSLKISLPTVPHFYSGYLLDTSDRVVMDTVGIGTADIGRYNASYSIANMIKIFGNASGTAIGPLMFESFKKKDFATARNLVFFLQALFLAGSFLVCIWLKEIFHLLIRNPELSSMYYLGVVIVMAYTYRPMYFGVISILQYYEHTNKTWQITFSAGAINVMLNFILLPIWGFEVAAYTTFVSLMLMGYGGYLFPIYKKLQNADYYPLRWLLLTVGLTASAILIVNWSVLNKIFVSLAFGLFILLMLKKYRQLKKQTKKKAEKITSPLVKEL